MSCTTLLVGRKASLTGATLVARNDDCSDHAFDPKKIIVVTPERQPREYVSKITGVHVTLPEKAMRYTAAPHVVPAQGVWAAAGVNEANVSMTATETITSNDRVRGADPLCEKADGTSAPDGIGEEDFIVLTLPYITSAREGVIRLGSLIEQYGTYEMNGIGFQDVNEIWWFETIGGHHWMAARVPDDCYVVMPNQLGIDSFDFNDAEGEQKAYMCSSDLRRFVLDHDLDSSMDDTVRLTGKCNPRLIFGSHEDADHVYNTPRAWDMERYLNPKTSSWYGCEAEYSPISDDIPWSRVPEHKLGVVDVKNVLSLHYQNTEYDPYGKGPEELRHRYRPVGINRTRFYCCVEIRPDVPKEIQAVQWITFGSNPFNAIVPFYSNVDRMPEYLGNTTTIPDSENNFYWANRFISVLADAHYNDTIARIERYQARVQSTGLHRLHENDRKAMEYREKKDGNSDSITPVLEKMNDEMSAFAKNETNRLLSDLLFETSLRMNNAFARSDV